MLKTSSATAHRLVLYQRDDCHLCEQALTVLAQARVPALSSVFIDKDASLEARYGNRVPVLCNTSTGSELDWPFDAPKISQWIGIFNGTD